MFKRSFVTILTLALLAVLVAATGASGAPVMPGSRVTCTTWDWGANLQGQLGDNTTTQRNTPVQVLGPGGSGQLDGTISIAPGALHKAALKYDSTVWTWGTNTEGELGDNTTTQRNTPVQVVGSGGSGYLTGVTKVASSHYHTLAQKTDGTVWGWGLNDYGQLGDNSATNRTTPVQLVGPDGTGSLNGVTAVATGYQFSVALRSDGTVWAWGRNNAGQLGDGTTTDRKLPAQVPGLTGIVNISCGNGHTIAQKCDGTVWAWGWNGMGMLGDNTATDRTSPVQVRGPGGVGFLTGAKAVSAGGAHSVALKSNGTVWAWGDNQYGALGDNTTTQRRTPVQVLGPGAVGTLSGISAVAGGFYHTACLKDDGTVWAFGRNGSGELGDNTTTQRNTPVQVLGAGGTGFLTGMTAITAGGAGTAALRPFAHGMGWGLNGDGQCNFPSPNSGFRSIATGWQHSLGIRTDGSIAAWGSSSGYTPYFPSPNSGFVSIAAGSSRSLGLKSDGTVAIFGYGSYEETGPSPNADFVAVACGSHHSLGLKSDGTIVGWGSNTFGQLNVPAPNSGFVAVAAGDCSSLGLRSDGTITAWGYNSSGQLNVPAPNWAFVSISMGYDHSIGLKADGSITAWGEWRWGATNVPAPNSGYVSCSAGAYYSLGLRSDGTIAPWGNAWFGEMSVTPPNSKYCDVYGGGYHSLALQEGYAPPWVTGITPNISARDRTLTGVVISGGQFRGPNANVTVQLKNAADTITGTVTSVTANQVTCDFTIPAGATYAAWDVCVTHNDDGRVGTLAGGFTVGEVKILSVNPTGAVRGNTLDVAIVGSCTSFANGVSVADFGEGITVNTMTVTDATHATANITVAGAATVGARDVNVVTGGDNPLPLAGGFSVQYPAPDATSVNPATGNRGQALTGVIISGTNFRGPAGNVTAQLKKGASTIGGTVTEVTATAITADFSIPAGAEVGAWDLYVKHNDDGKSDTLAGAFDVQYPPPEVTGIDPVSGNRGETLTGVVIAGTDFRGPAGNVTAQLRNGASTIAGTVTDVTATAVTADFVIPADAAFGAWDVYVKHNDDNKSDTLAGGFDVQYPPPDVTGINPNNGNRTETVGGAEISGTGFRDGAVVQLKNGSDTINAANLVITATKITCDLALPSDATIGLWDVFVLNTDGKTSTLASAFNVQYPMPQPMYLTPDNAAQGQAVIIVTSGYEFRGPAGNVTIQLKNGASLITGTVTDVTSNAITADFAIPAAATPGAWNMYIEHNDDHKSATLFSVFTVRDARITGISPAHANQGQTLDVIVTGTDTAFVDGTSAASFGSGVTVNSTTVTDSNHATVNITVSGSASVGTRDVNVVTGGETPDPLMAGFTVEYPPPEVTSIDPASGRQGQTLIVAIGGTDFRGPVSNVTVSLLRGTFMISGTVTDVTSSQITAEFAIPTDATRKYWDVYVEQNDDHKNDTLTYAFEVQGFTLTPSAGAHGSISPDTPQTVDYNGSQTFNFSPATGYHVADVKVDDVSVGAPDHYDFTAVRADHNVDVTFAINTYTITPSAGANGSISPDTVQTVDYDGGKSFTFSAATGYHVADVKVDDVSVGAPGHYDFTNVTANHTIDVTFAINTYTLTPTGYGPGTIDPDTVQTVDHGGGQGFVFTPDHGYHVGDVKVDDVSVGAPDTYDFTNVTANHTLDIYFSANHYTITPTAVGNGSIDPGIPQDVVFDDSVTFNFSQNPGSYISDVKVDGASVGAPDSYDFYNVDSNHTVAVTFTAYTYDVNASVTGGHGRVSPAARTVEWGTDASIAIVPDTGYQVDSITDNGVSKAATESYRIENVTEDHDVVVTFKPLPVVKAPSIASLSPDRGPSGTTVTIKGADFGYRLTSGRGLAAAVSPSYVMFNQTQAVDYVSWSNKEIKVRVPAGAVPGPVTVTTPQGTSNADKTFTPTYALTPFYFLAEGSTGYGFDTWINIENPMDEDLNVSVNFLLTDGKVQTEMVGLPKSSQTTINPRDFVGSADFSTRVDCVQGKMIAVDRTMTWKQKSGQAPLSRDAELSEGHSSIGTTSLQKTWYLAEGSAAWGFDTWTLAANPNDKDTRVTLSYMLEGGGVKEVEKTVRANARASWSMADDIGNLDASVLVTSDLPVVVERSMYRNERREGSCSIGTPSPGSNFYLAEGTSSWGFTTYVLIENPNPSPAGVTLTYMTPSGPSVQPAFTMPASSRKTVRVNDTIKDTDFSIQVSSDRPVIAERAMYWDSATGEACHASSGACSSHETFYLPDGSTKDGTETYTLVANPNATAVDVEITYLTPGGKDNITFTDSIAPNSRRTYSLADKLPDGRASIKVTSKTAGKGIVVERSMYWNNRGAGTDTIGAFIDN